MSIKVILSDEIPKNYRDIPMSLIFPAPWSTNNGCTMEQAKQIEEDVISWLKQIGVISDTFTEEHIRSLNISGFAGPAKLIGKDMKHMLLIAKIITTFLLWDNAIADDFENPEETCRQLQLIFQGEEVPQDVDDPYLKAWKDIFKSYVDMNCSTDFLTRFGKAMSHYCYYLILEKEISEDPSLTEKMTLEELWEVRNITSGIYLLALPIEACCDVDIDTEIYCSPLVQRLLSIAAQLVRICNEIASFPNDYAEGGYCNLVNWTMKKAPSHNTRDALATITHFVSMHNQTVIEFDDVAEQLAQKKMLSPNMEKWIDMLRYAIKGLAHWQSEFSLYAKHTLVDEANQTYSTLHIE